MSVMLLFLRYRRTLQHCVEKLSLWAHRKHCRSENLTKATTCNGDMFCSNIIMSSEKICGLVTTDSATAMNAGNASGDQIWPRKYGKYVA
jgi:hypothetical protein